MKSKGKVLLGLSGGVDSSVAALLLKKQGYEVIGCFLKCFSETKDPLTGECSWVKEKQMAQKIAAHLEIPFIILDLEKQYKKEVILPMIKGYERGLTPNPDISCNTIIKFPWLWKEAQKLNCKYIATGHYARIKSTKSGFQLLSGKDKTKDQTYFLSELSQQDLSHTIFPIGNLSKKEVREIAKKNKFPNYNKPGTRGICFVGKVNMKSFLEKTLKNHPGKVLDDKGNVLGTHPGVQYYTIGQKIGEHIGIKIKRPKELSQKKLYIADKTKNNELIVVPECHPLLSKKEITLFKPHFINPKDKIPLRLSARIRHLGTLYSGKLIKSNNRFKFIANSPISSVAEGQFIVLYDKQICLGNGEIRLK
jgi:tRNA-specific 2-thiouridylase